jgi:hypothetical protein
MDIGKPRHRVDVSDELQRIAEEDEKSGIVLMESGLYRNAMYFYIQSMEKRVRSQTFKLVDPYNPYWRNINQHHDLYSSVNFLVEALGMDTLVAKQVEEMINKYIIGNINFRMLHNNLRYPYFSEKHNTYSCISYYEEDCSSIYDKLNFLKNLLNDLDKYR